jgi:small-conductance mechanosensitive channel
MGGVTPTAQIQVDWPGVVRRIFSEETAFWASMLILVLGAVVAYLAYRWTRQLMKNADVPATVEGTPFERTAQRFGTSTVGIVAILVAVFVYLGAVFLALSIAQLLDSTLFWQQLTTYLPRLFVAALATITGLVVGDKARLLVSERLRSVKLPEVGIIPELVKYSIFYIAALIALGQIGVAIDALVVLLAVYALGVILVSLVAFWDLLRAGAAGIYILLNQPYSIGDRIRIDGNEGIVQEVDMFTTHIENDGEEYIVPNQRVFRSGVVRIRQ